MKKSAIALILALSFIEWLDFSLYLYLAKSIFAPLFFPKNNAGLMLTFGLFAAAYLARPLGGWLFGLKADKKGRKLPMLFTAALMGAATLGMCLLPTYDQIGIAAAWILLLLRIAQGLALGGEFNTSAIFLIEHQQTKPLLVGSWLAASGALGMFVGGAVAALLHYGQMPNAWRVVFASVGALSLFISYRRQQLSESPAFNPHAARQPVNWRNHKRQLANVALAGAYVSITVYICNVFWVSFATDVGFASSIQCAWLGALVQLFSALLALPIAWFAKPQQVQKLFQASMCCAIITAPLLFLSTAQSFFWGVLGGLVGYILTNALLCSALFYFLYLQLPPEIRCRGVSTMWGLAASLGAISLPLAQYYAQQQHISFAIILIMLIATAGILFSKTPYSRKEFSPSYA